jgi:electron transfer flavoprotein alpha subunit
MIYAEQTNYKLRKASREILGYFSVLAQEQPLQVTALVVGAECNEVIKEIGRCGVRDILVMEGQEYQTYHPNILAQAVVQGASDLRPDYLVLANTAVGKDIAPRVGGKLGWGCVSDVIDLELTDNLTFVKPIYAGKALAQIAGNGQKPLIVTVRPNALKAVDPSPVEPVVSKGVTPDLTGNEHLGYILKEVVAKVTGKTPPLTEADIIVSGGRGMKGPENFVLLEELAEVLGAAVGASRAAVDAGWREHQYQVGQTGKTVSPSLYIACGISGAIQHLAGMSSARTVVAINKDPNAPIFKIADFGIVGDALKILPILTAELKKHLKQTQ